MKIMDYRAVFLFSLIILVTFIVSHAAGDQLRSRTKKVVIHVPYKVKRIKHTHTIYKTVHHHHTHHEPHLDALPTEEHEHYHHMHLHEDPSPQHSQPVPGIGIPDFLPDVPLDVPLDVPINIPDIPKHPHPHPNRLVPLYRRA